jgi:1-deoxy-D-xylulose-5-phosphate reductoisomerase
MKLITILGATGSIGMSTLDVLRLHPQAYKVFALTGRQRIDVLAAQCIEFKPQFAVVPDDAARLALRARLDAASCATEILVGEQALCDVCASPEVDMVMSAIVGAAGLKPTLAAAHAGKRILLANKEALVVGGDLLTNVISLSGGSLVPIDSEHSAIFQCLPRKREAWPQDVQRLVLTASGGPFLRTPLAEMARATPEQAVAHPNWVMGRKISVDSATMMNKGLEVIEAHYLFGFEPSRIDVLIHPQSIIHSMVEMIDGSVMAQLGSPDMRTPIALGLSYPKRVESGAPKLDFLKLRALEFFEPETERFPCLNLAYEALQAGQGAAAVLNAANEVAVDRFLQHGLPFGRIADVCHDTLSRMPRATVRQLDDVLALDAQARRFAAESAQRFSA